MVVDLIYIYKKVEIHPVALFPLGCFVDEMSGLCSNFPLDQSSFEKEICGSG